MSTTIDADIAVVGAGPAGLHAALAAAAAGARVLLVDENPEPGGQYYRQLPAAFEVPDRSRLDPDFTKADALLARVRAEPGITLLSEAAVWGSSGPGRLEALQRRRSITLRARRTVVATGAIERPGVFPGWDLPGVMTPGAAQTLVKGQGILPGERIVLAGSGPFLLPVAQTLVRAGRPPVGLHEAGHPLDWVRHAWRLWGHGDRVAEALAYRRTLARAGVPVHFRTVVVRAEGDGSLERAVLADCDREGHPLPGTERAIEADTLCVGFGFVPSVQLTRILGCRHVYDARAGGWIPALDDDLRTSERDVFVAGEAAGIGGAWAAMAEGALAASGALADLGFAAPAPGAAALRRERRKRRAFAALVNELFAPPAGMLDPVTDDTLVCRCEEVTAGELRAACRPWGANVNFVKGATRCGMGYCQGRICGPVAEALVARELGLAPGTIDHFHPREPIRPVRVADLAARHVD